MRTDNKCLPSTSRDSSFYLCSNIASIISSFFFFLFYLSYGFIRWQELLELFETAKSDPSRGAGDQRGESPPAGSDCTSIYPAGIDEMRLRGRETSTTATTTAPGKLRNANEFNRDLSPVNLSFGRTRFSNFPGERN